MSRWEPEELLAELGELEASEAAEAGGVTDELLQRYREGVLSPEEERRVEQRLVASAPARQRLVALAGITASAPPERVRRAALASFASARSRPWLQRHGWAAAAAAAFVLVGSCLLWPRLRSGSDGVLPGYEVTIAGLAEERSTAAAAVTAEAYPETRVSISAAAEDLGTPGELGLFVERPAASGRLERLEVGGAIRFEQGRGGARFEAPAAALVGTLPGEHTVYLVVASDLPAGPSSLERLAALGCQLYPLHIHLRAAPAEPAPAR